jgi:uncharacterized protein (DUF433 family)
MIAGTKKQKRATIKLPKLVKEEIHGVVIEYYPIGKYVVIQPGVQGGLPTIKNTRITAGVLVGWVGKGYTPEEVARDYRIAPEAVKEAVELAKIYDYDRRYACLCSTSNSA